MAELLRYPEIVTSVRYTLCFDRHAPDTGGFAFECSADGLVDESSLNPAAAANLARCRANPECFRPAYVNRYEWTYKEPGVVRCVCGAEVELASTWANSCEVCDREYNGSGQLLAPRSQWGEETGETSADFIGL
jgi:hypothetical protein